MLPKSEMVRKAIEDTYIGVCSISESKKVIKPNKSTAFVDETVVENESCKLSFSSIASASSGEVATTVSQVVKLFISPDITVKPGSKITVTQNGVTADYKGSGEPAIYPTHQEIILELFKGWA